MRVAQVGGQRQHVARDTLTSEVAALQRAHREAVTEVVDPRRRRAGLHVQIDGSQQSVKRPVDHGVAQCPAFGGDKDVVIAASAGWSLLKVALQGAHCGRV